MPQISNELWFVFVRFLLCESFITLTCIFCIALRADLVLLYYTYFWYYCIILVFCIVQPCFPVCTERPELNPYDRSTLFFPKGGRGPAIAAAETRDGKYTGGGAVLLYYTYYVLFLY